MGVEKKVLSIRLDEKMIRDLRVCAEKENRNLSNLIETILKDYLKKQK
ncbi:ribbon-helix-helix protein, CopG family [Christensenella intestinihominis]|nr:ribbon-helix-helix protein, CopG family [Christensenella intestinihominis]